MKERNVTITLSKAREWYNSGNASLKEVALRAFNRAELEQNFRNILTCRDAYKALSLNCDDMYRISGNIATVSRASAAMFKLNIVRKALHLDQDLSLTEGINGQYMYCPDNPFITDDCTYFDGKIRSNRVKVIGKISSRGREYYVLSGDATSVGDISGLGCFYSENGIGYAYPEYGLLGCASEEIAQHFGRYFGMLITEAKYGDLVDFEIIRVY